MMTNKFRDILIIKFAELEFIMGNKIQGKVIPGQF
jgi:hypothetical protein